VLVLHGRTWRGDRRRSGLQVLVRMEGGETREAKARRHVHSFHFPKSPSSLLRNTPTRPINTGFVGGGRTRKDLPCR